MNSGEFRKFDHGASEKNQKAYGSDDPPAFDLGKIKDYNIMLVCGKTDLLSSPPDYNWLHEVLKKNGNNVIFKEYELGHLGLLMPKDK